MKVGGAPGAGGLAPLTRVASYVPTAFGVGASTKDLQSTSRYNTYVRPGLPPGPIGNPGADAIEAALRPATGPWLFFVVTDPEKGVTKFAASEREFFKLVRERKKHG
ncbi:endolytic transglycosylase MltG [Streptosporangium sp. NPDC005286]|uniref:endolytic transglycosylase MltG n=1 Tax=Streptosporangium sp. NPDC005286 TaxID=3154463 RepID=UPI0033ADD0C3